MISSGFSGQIIPRNYGFLNEQLRSSKKKDAEKVLTAMMRKIDDGELLHEPTRMGVKDYLEHWLETAAKPKITAGTLED